ncbi:Aquaporin Z [Anatilimnocola aggregata]|uniref:Aquaporin Z n=1 Tax=Anatilimnocola aggregata TaxID=2528021 RepID=A0A517YDA7_9BACT|nr:aquaporin [Anatilimnocola aggregata]QDU28220.1 Aquaporin Z [Anatilimnocola aggregata]
MRHAFKHHWPEYCMEAAELAIFMLAACVAAVVLFDPTSPAMISSPWLRRLLMGMAMGGTAVAIVYSPWGKQSGAHFNPAVTLTFWRLGKIETWDAVFYVVFQFAGGVAGVLFAAAVLGQAISVPGVDYIVTVPGSQGTPIAFLAEFAISFLLMSTVLLSSNSRRLAPYTGCLVGLLLVCFVLFESPLSGMSMNPARTFASAWPAQIWTAWWIYFLAPPLAMLTAAEIYARVQGLPNVRCAKLHHDHRRRCIFRCGYRPPEHSTESQASQSQPAKDHL